MASVSWEGANRDRARIVFRDAAGKQQTLRLGQCTKRTAQNALTGFERVLESHRTGSTLHPDGVRWLESIDDRLHARVARLGLVQPRKAADVATLGALLDRFVNNAAVKPATRAAYKQTTDSLRAFFGGTKPLPAITPADADGWRKAIAEPEAEPKEVEACEPARKALAPATVAKRVHVARAIFRRAVRWGMIPASPFAELRAGSQANPARSVYVDPASIRAVLAACPDTEWRGIVALSRYAGLRCPSEIVGLTWADVNWARGRLTVRSPKTAGHDGHAVRVVPIAPELRPILQDLFDAAEPWTEAVIPRLPDARLNLRTTFTKIILRAGLKPWPRLFHNLRASCACDWVETFPAHVVASWLGHSPMIAAQHYLQTRDTHFDRAAGLDLPSEKAAANPAAQAPPTPNTLDQATSENVDIAAVLAALGIACDPVQNGAMGGKGLEPLTLSV